MQDSSPAPEAAPVAALATVWIDPADANQCVVAVAGTDGVIRIFLPATQTFDSRTIEGAGAGVVAVATYPGFAGDRVAAADSTGVIWIWDMAADPAWTALTVEREPSTACSLTCLTGTGEGPVIALAEAGSGALHLWNASTGAVIPPLNPAPTNVCAIAAYPAAGETVLALATADGLVRLWDTGTGAVLATSSQPLAAGGARALAAVTMSGGLPALAIAGRESGIQIWQPQLDTAVITAPTSGPVVAMASLPSGGLVTATDSGIDVLEISEAIPVAPPTAGSPSPGSTESALEKALLKIVKRQIRKDAEELGKELGNRVGEWLNKRERERAAREAQPPPQAEPPQLEPVTQPEPISQHQPSPQPQPQDEEIARLQQQQDRAMALGRHGKYAEAAQLLQIVADGRARVLGPGHPDTLYARLWQANHISNASNHRQAVRLLRQLVTDYTSALGPDHPDTLTARVDLGNTTGRAGRYGQASRLSKTLAADCTRVLGPEHLHTLIARHNHAHFLGRKGNRLKAIRLLRDLLRDQTRALGADHYNTKLTAESLHGLEAARQTPEQAKTNISDSKTVFGGLVGLILFLIVGIPWEIVSFDGGPLRIILTILGVAFTSLIAAGIVGGIARVGLLGTIVATIGSLWIIGSQNGNRVEASQLWIVLAAAAAAFGIEFVLTQIAISKRTRP